MRFRLATTGAAADPMTQGIGNGMRSLMMLPMLQAQGAEEAQKSQSESDLRAAQQAQAAAHAALFQQQAAAEQDQLHRGSVGELLKSAALQQGVPLSQLDEATQYLQTGDLAGKYRLPGGQQGPIMPSPQYADPTVGQKIMQTLGLTRQALTVGDKDVAHIADSAGKYQDQGITQQALDAAARGDDMGMSRINTIRGKKEFTPYAAVGTTGVALNQVTGQGSVAEQGLRTLFGDVQGANIQKDKAAAASSYASADHSRASTDKVREETAQLRNAPKGVLVQTDAGPVFADPRSGKSVPVLNGDGTPAAPKLKDIPATQSHAFTENAKALMNIDDAMDAITKATGIKLDENGNPVRMPGATGTAPDALGARNYLGDGIRQRTDPNGVPVRAKVANIGSQKLHDLSGANVTVSEAPRLQPLVPLPTDGPAAALQKLQNLRREYQLVNDMFQQTYSREQGFRPSVAARPGGGGGGADPLGLRR